MSTWRDMLARFRKETPAVVSLEAIEDVESTTAVAIAEPAALHKNAHDETPVEIADDHDVTHRFGDTTRSLASSVPQLAALMGERVLQAAALRDIGRERSENQDHCFAQIWSFPTDGGDAPLGIFVVADGMGGHHDGGYASRLALTTTVQCIIEEFVTPVLRGESPILQPIMQAAVQSANAAVFNAGQSAGNDMGTTCTAVLLHGNQLVTAHVGDSRALLIGSGIKQLTTDHSAVGRLIAIGALTAEEAREHPLRNQLYRSIGQQHDVSVDVATTKLADESHLVLCSDGLWGLVPEPEIIDIVTEAPTPHMAARHLIARANLLGGHDNISAVVVTLPTGVAA